MSDEDLEQDDLDGADEDDGEELAAADDGDSGDDEGDVGAGWMHSDSPCGEARGEDAGEVGPRAGDGPGRRRCPTTTRP